MARHTFSADTLVVQGFAPAAFTSGTQNGTSVDLQGSNGGVFRRAALVVDLNPGLSTTGNFQLQDSPDNTAWTNVANATLTTPVAASTDAIQIVNIDTSKRQRYLRVQIIGTGTAGAASAKFHLFEADHMGLDGFQSSSTISV